MSKKVVISILLTLVLFECKKPREQAHLGEMANDPLLAHHNQTKLVKSGDIQIAFDLMSMPYHKQMMRLMKADMKHTEGETHGLMLTIMDYKTKETIKHAQVKITIESPDGKTNVSDTQIMSGAGMYHYAMHLKANQKGEYKIKAKVEARNKSYFLETNFSPRKTQ